MNSPLNLLLHLDECKLNNQAHNQMESSQYIIIFLKIELIVIRIILIYCNIIHFEYILVVPFIEFNFKCLSFRFICFGQEQMRNGAHS